MYLQSINKKNIKKFLLKIFNFYNLRKINILHGHVFVMKSNFHRGHRQDKTSITKTCPCNIQRFFEL